MSWGSQGRKDLPLQGNCASPEGSLSALKPVPLRSPAGTFSPGNPVLDSHSCTRTPNSHHFGTGDLWQRLLKSKLRWAHRHHQEEQFGSGNGRCEHIPLVCSGDSVRGSAGHAAEPLLSCLPLRSHRPAVLLSSLRAGVQTSCKPSP